jgi:hypothetical protein
LENALVRRVNRRIPIRMVRLLRSTSEVEMWFSSGSPITGMMWYPVQVEGL